jgi:choline dehydrogenase-like flavoprotein
MDHTYSIGVSGVVPAAAKFKYNFEDGRNNGVYIPKFRNVGNDKQKNFLRGYGIQATVGHGMLPTNLRAIPGFGAAFKKHVREAEAPPAFWMGAFGEMLPRKENRVTVNKDKKDAWGIPVAHIDCQYSENEREMAKDQLTTMKEMVTEAGFQIFGANPYLSNPGLCIHEVGTARMGTDPKSSVLNKFNQSWDVKNLFITDGACFVSQGCQNPTLTMMALTARACEYIVDQSKKGNL